MKKKKLIGTSLAMFQSWQKERNITPDKIIARLKRRGINKDLFEWMDLDIKKWERGLHRHPWL